jgi:hypothetical protein
MSRSTSPTKGRPYISLYASQVILIELLQEVIQDAHHLTIDIISLQVKVQEMYTFPTIQEMAIHLLQDMETNHFHEIVVTPNMMAKEDEDEGMM